MSFFSKLFRRARKTHPIPILRDQLIDEFDGHFVSSHDLAKLDEEVEFIEIGLPAEEELDFEESDDFEVKRQAYDE